MIPDFQTLMRPILEEVTTQDSVAIRVVIDRMSERFGLTAADRDTRLASGQPVIYNRVHWAVTHLAKAGLLARPARGTVAITDAGRAELSASHPINMARLRAVSPDYVAFTRPAVDAPNLDTPGPVLASPEEAMSAAYVAHRQVVAAELLSQLKAAPPSLFERVVIDLLLAMGYGRFRPDAGQHLGGTGDAGVDGMIREDKLGLDVIYIQAKRWEGTVGRETVQAFAGSLEGQRAKRGVIFTTSRFSQGATEYVAGIEKRIALIDGPTLAGLMIDYGVGVETANTYLVRKIDHDYFELA